MKTEVVLALRVHSGQTSERHPARLLFLSASMFVEGGRDVCYPRRTEPKLHHDVASMVAGPVNGCGALLPQDLRRGPQEV